MTQKDLIQWMESEFVRPLRISYVSPRFRRSKDWEHSEYNLNKKTKKIRVFEHGEYREYTPYEYRRTKPAHFSKRAREEFIILWDTPPEPVPPSELPKYRKAVRGCVKSIYRGEKSTFGRYAIFESDNSYSRRGCETLEDAEAEAWIYCIENNVFAQAEQTKNPDAYIWESIKKEFRKSESKGVKSMTVEHNLTTITQFSTTSGGDYGHSMDGIEGQLIDRAMGYRETPARIRPDSIEGPTKEIPRDTEAPYNDILDSDYRRTDSRDIELYVVMVDLRERKVEWRERIRTYAQKAGNDFYKRVWETVVHHFGYEKLEDVSRGELQKLLDSYLRYDIIRKISKNEKADEEKAKNRLKYLPDIEVKNVSYQQCFTTGPYGEKIPCCPVFIYENTKKTNFFLSIWRKVPLCIMGGEGIKKKGYLKTGSVLDSL